MFKLAANVSNIKHTLKRELFGKIKKRSSIPLGGVWEKLNNEMISPQVASTEIYNTLLVNVPVNLRNNKFVELMNGFWLLSKKDEATYNEVWYLVNSLFDWADKVWIDVSSSPRSG